MENPSRRIIISGGLENSKNPWHPSKIFTTQVGKIYRYLREKGVSKENICFEDKSTNTRENVVYCCKKFENKKIDKLIICSDSEHASRLKMLFEKAKKYGLAESNLKIDSYSEKMDDSYGSLKTKIAYLKDFLICSGKIRTKP